MSKSKLILLTFGLLTISIISFFAYKYVSAQLACTCAGGNGCNENCGIPDPDCGVCNDNLTNFDSGPTAVINLLAGGCDSTTTITLPMTTGPWNPRICATSVDIDFTGPPLSLTPFIWIPASTQNKLIQLRTSDGSLVHVFQNGSDNCLGGPSFNDPSRITVIPGGDIWVANRNSATVTRLGRIVGCVGDDCYECKGTYGTCGTDVRGITFDSEGNIWAGSYISDCLVRLCGSTGCTDVNGVGGYAIGQIMDIDAAGGTQIGAEVYGLIGDSYGNVWASGPTLGNVSRVDINDNTALVHITGVGAVSLYGIGIDNEGDIWVGRAGNTGLWGIDGEDIGGAGIGTVEPTEQCPTASTTTGLAVDLDNNVWGTGFSGNSVIVVAGEDCAQTFSRTAVCSHWPFPPHGFAISANNHAWLVCDTGEAIEYVFHDDGDAILINDGNDDIEELQRINLCALPGVGCGNASGDTYNYSDMTGLRTPALSVTIGTTTFPMSNTLTNFGCSLEETVQTCACAGCNIMPCSAPEWWGFSCCQVPIEVCTTFSAGQYTLSNLSIDYLAPPPSCTLTANPGTINFGGSSTLDWTTRASTSGIISNNIDATTINAAPIAVGNAVVSPVVTTTYTLTVTGPGGISTCSATVVINPPICNLIATPNAINFGGSSTLDWTTSSAVSGIITNNIDATTINAVPLAAGNAVVSPVVTTIYTMTVTAPMGNGTCSATVTVNPPSCTLIANPSAINMGDFSTLEWTTTSAASGIITNNIDATTINALPIAAGNAVVSPVVTTIYTMTVTAPMGNGTCSAKVTVLFPSPGGLVPCGRRYDDPTTNLDESAKCSLCHTLVLTKRGIDFGIIAIIPPLVGILIIAAGGFLIFSGGNPQNIAAGKGILKTAGIGAALALGGWLLIEIVITGLVPNSAPWRDWKEVVCDVEPCAPNGICDTAAVLTANEKITKGTGEDAQSCPTDCACNLVDGSGCGVAGLGKKECSFDGTCQTNERVAGVNPQSCPDCAVCGNNIKDIGEECDGNDYGAILNQKIIVAGGRDCGLVGGYSSGVFSCSAECKLDRKSCQQR